MYSKFEETSLLGMSNSELFLAEKDPKVIGFDILLRSTLEFSDGYRIADSENHELPQEEEEKKDDKREGVVSSDELKMPSLGEFKVEDDDDGFRTPTSLDHKTIVIQRCPPAPRKPRSLPSTKRKVSSNRHQLLLDLSEEVESLFPPALLADLGRKIKKVRGDNDY